MTDLRSAEEEQLALLDDTYLELLYEKYILLEASAMLQEHIIPRASDINLILDVPHFLSKHPGPPVLHFIRNSCDSNADLHRLFTRKPFELDLKLLEPTPISVNVTSQEVPASSSPVPERKSPGGKSESSAFSSQAAPEVKHDTECIEQAIPNVSDASKLVATAAPQRGVNDGPSSQDSVATPLVSPLPVQTRQASLASDLDSSTPKEQIAERAKLEAHVLSRIAELRKRGMWSLRRLPKVHEPPRHKTHWDYLLEEAQWLSTDYAGERKWKKNTARKWAAKVTRYHADKLAASARVQREHRIRLRKIASTMAKEVRSFWANIEKIVDFKQDAMLDKKRKQALNLQLDFLVEKSEKFSTLLTEGLSSQAACQPHLKDGASNLQTSSQVQQEPTTTDDLEDDKFHDASDAVFELPKDSLDEDEDEEETIEKEEEIEAREGDMDHGQELADLADEANIPIDELLKRYQAAYEQEPYGQNSVSQSHNNSTRSASSVDNSSDASQRNSSDEDISDDEEMETEPNSESDEPFQDVGLESLLGDIVSFFMTI